VKSNRQLTRWKRLPVTHACWLMNSGRDFHDCMKNWWTWHGCTTNNGLTATKSEIKIKRTMHIACKRERLSADKLRIHLYHCHCYISYEGYLCFNAIWNKFSEFCNSLLQPFGNSFQLWKEKEPRKIDKQEQAMKDAKWIAE
jgi:hypothetical protein